MHVSIVYVHVKSDHINDFIAATEVNHRASIQEPGNRRFDVLQSTNEPAHFVLYEAYAHVDDVTAHKQTTHYLQWRDTVAEWMASPREGVTYEGLFPQG